jgi:hypothetical protein
VLWSKAHKTGVYIIRTEEIKVAKGPDDPVKKLMSWLSKRRYYHKYAVACGNIASP